MAHAPVKYVEKGLSFVANGLWYGYAGLSKLIQKESFTPAWSDKPLQKSWEKTKPVLGFPRETDSLCPNCVIEARKEILDGRKDVSVLDQREGRRDQGADHRARRQDPDGEGLPHSRPLRGRDVDRPGDVQAPGRRVPGPRHRRAQRREAPQPRQQHDQARPRLGAHHRPDQPLQHDVRPVLHGREPGGLRARADLGRHQDGARQRHLNQAAPPDVGAVLRRRADHVAVLPRRGPLREEGGLQQRPGGHQRHRVREEPRVLPPGGRSRPALRLPAVRRHRQRRQLAPPRRQPVRREAARHREHVERRHRHRAGHHDRQRREQRAGRPGHRVRPRQPQEDLVPLVPAGVLHGPRRGGHARAPRGPALHAGPPRARREEPDGHRRAGARLVPDLRSSRRSPTGPTR